MAQWIAGVASFLTILSACLNVIQFYKRREEQKSLRAFLQGEYNTHFLVARACSRFRKSPEPAKLQAAFGCIERITGAVDTARVRLVAYGREHLNFLPKYEHPAFPGKEQPKAVVLGTPPDELTRKNNQEP